MTLRQKIILLGMVAVAGVLVTFWLQYQNLDRQRLTADSIRQHVAVMRVLSGVVHELQKERGLTSIHHCCDNQQALPQQIQSSDAALARLQNAGIESRELTESLTKLRAIVASGKFDLLEAFALYSVSIRGLIDEMETQAEIPEAAAIEEDLTAYIHLITAKEYLGQIRGTIGHWIEFKDHSHSHYQNLLHIQQDFAEELRKVRRHHSPVLELLNSHLAGEDARRMQDIVTETITNRRPTMGLEGRVWFSIATMVIDHLKDSEDRSLGLIEAKSEDVYRQTQDSIYFGWSVMAIAGITALLLTFSAAGSLMRSLNLTVRNSNYSGRPK